MSEQRGNTASENIQRPASIQTAPWWQGEEERRITYRLDVHLAIAAGLVIGFGVAWLLLPVIERAVAR